MERYENARYRFTSFAFSAGLLYFLASLLAAATMKTPESLFTAEDRARLAAAVDAAERATSGEIVPYIVGQSDAYPEAPWRAGTLLGALVLLTLTIVTVASKAWLPYGLLEATVLTACACALGAVLVTFFAPLRRLALSPSTMTERVNERAAMAFLSEEVFTTRDRSGILIFLSLFERRVRVMADSGISKVVKQEEWDGIVALIVRGMKEGTAAAALEEAIARCGALLTERGMLIREDDTNELDDGVRFG